MQIASCTEWWMQLWLWCCCGPHAICTWRSLVSEKVRTHWSSCSVCSECLAIARSGRRCLASCSLGIELCCEYSPTSCEDSLAEAASLVESLGTDEGAYFLLAACTQQLWFGTAWIRLAFDPA